MGLLGTLLAWQVFLIVTWPEASTWVGFDYRTYMSAARDWLAGDGFYEARQLAGPYTVQATEVLYPPVVLLVLVPFTYLPALAWWAVPIGITAGVVWSHRPSAWASLAILACLTLPLPKGMSWAQDAIFNGNPVLWVMAAVALATRWPVFGPWALVKFTLAPFALVGIRSRAWWVGLAMFVVACALFLPMWPDYVTVMRNAEATGNPLLYSIANVPLVAIPLVASLGATRGRRGSAPSWYRTTADRVRSARGR